eukprot:1054783-Pleurochrysis_carterae.AAC.3
MENEPCSWRRVNAVTERGEGGATRRMQAWACEPGEDVSAGDVCTGCRRDRSRRTRGMACAARLECE